MTEKKLYIPWAEKKKGLGHIVGEEKIAKAWDRNENLFFYYIMWLGTF